MILLIVVSVLSTACAAVCVTGMILALRAAARARADAVALTEQRTDVHRLGIDLDTISRRLRRLNGIVSGVRGGRPRKNEPAPPTDDEVDEDEEVDDDQFDAFIHLQSAK